MTVSGYTVCIAQRRWLSSQGLFLLAIGFIASQIKSGEPWGRGTSNETPRIMQLFPKRIPGLVAMMRLRQDLSWAVPCVVMRMACAVSAVR